jgi:metallo-beta-lactamase family protein
MAGSGMCTGGRIMNHLQNHLPDPTTLVLMVGYQAKGSLGRTIQEGAKTVRVAGKVVDNRARIHTLSGLSGHADQNGLLEWIGTMAPSRPRVILMHGESKQRAAMQERIQERFGLDSETPTYLDTIEF